MDLSALATNPRLSKALIGMPHAEFSTLAEAFDRALNDIRMAQPGRQRAVGGGKKGVLDSPQARLFFVLLYFKTYPTFDVLGFFFGKPRGRCCTDIHLYTQAMEKTLGHKQVLPKRKIRSAEEFVQAFPEITEVLLDGTERTIRRPKGGKRQRKTYSGKKKSHTRKNLVMADESKRILLVSPTKSGRRHDKRLADKIAIARAIPSHVGVTADSGFQGITHPRLLIPKKGSKRRPLTVEEKESNRIISSFRVAAEHAIAGVKRFGVLSGRFRNRIGRFDDRCMVVGAGLWNFHLQCAAV